MLYDLKAEIRYETEPEDIYTLYGKDENGKVTAVITYYTDKDGMPEKRFNIDFGKERDFDIYLLDKTHDTELFGTKKELDFTMKSNSSIMIKER